MSSETYRTIRASVLRMIDAESQRRMSEAGASNWRERMAVLRPKYLGELQGGPALTGDEAEEFENLSATEARVSTILAFTGDLKAKLSIVDDSELEDFRNSIHSGWPD